MNTTTNQTVDIMVWSPISSASVFIPVSDAGQNWASDCLNYYDIATESRSRDYPGCAEFYVPVPSTGGQIANAITAGLNVVEGNCYGKAIWRWVATPDGIDTEPLNAKKA
jgi:hypothetical protein